MAVDLAAYLRLGMERPFDRASGFDCAMWVASWVASRTGVDPAAHLRGRYATALAAARLIRPYGDFETMWRVCMAIAGFNETRSPVDGDVGVVLTAEGHPVAAIRAYRMWAAKAERGLLLEDMRMRIAWSLSRG